MTLEELRREEERLEKEEMMLRRWLKESQGIGGISEGAETLPLEIQKRRRRIREIENY